MSVVSPRHDTAESVESERVEKALRNLPESLRTLNEIYLRHLHSRTMLDSADAAAWPGKQAIVFLRHDRERVFAVVRQQRVAMADFVSLTDVSFHVDVIGRRQSNAEEGPLPNKRTIHAYLTGTLVSISDHGKLPDPKLWEPVEYHPLRYAAFIRSELSLPIWAADRVELVPAAAKVWCWRTHSDECSQPLSGDDSP